MLHHAFANYAINYLVSPDNTLREGEPAMLRETAFRFHAQFVRHPEMQVHYGEPPGAPIPDDPEHYGWAKEVAREFAENCTRGMARSQGYSDAYEMLLRSDDEGWQIGFLIGLPNVLGSPADRRVLLDGLAREYRGVIDWKSLQPKELSADEGPIS